MITTSRNSRPLSDHAYHLRSNAELLYIIKDASEAAIAMKGHDQRAEAKYLDQVNDAITIMAYRRKVRIARNDDSVARNIKVSFTTQAIGTRVAEVAKLVLIERNARGFDITRQLLDTIETNAVNSFGSMAWRARAEELAANYVCDWELEA